VVELRSSDICRVARLAMMARLQRRADDKGLALRWRGFNEHVLNTIHVTGRDAYLSIEA
jgi:hypothetical protein